MKNNVLTIIAALILLAACTKEKQFGATYNAYWLSEKYTIDMRLIKTDTSNRWTNISERQAMELRNTDTSWIDFSDCPVPTIPALPEFKIEKLYWVVKKN